MRILVSTLLAFSLAARPAPAAEREHMDRAIDNALQYLQRHQNAEGAWTVGATGNAAVTSLAVMAFLSAGHVPGEGRYGDTLKNGIEWVLKKQNPHNGIITSDPGQEMYQHGISTLMLAEVAGMTDGDLGKRVRRQLEKAVEIILKAQRRTNPGSPHYGGWRYRVQGQDSDISVTGWQLMALRAAKNLGCDVPAESIDLAIAYIKRCQDKNTGGFRYYPGGNLTVPCTGTSILGLEICGKHQHHSPEALRAAGYLLKNAPRWGSPYFFYGIYYCSQAAFQLGGNYWNDFRPKMHKELFAHQLPDGRWEAGHGPSYSTAMGVLALTVEYRFLPIYQRSEEPTEK